jgi:hypothetical protein
MGIKPLCEAVGWCRRCTTLWIEMMENFQEQNQGTFNALRILKAAWRYLVIVIVKCLESRSMFLRNRQHCDR